MDKLPGAVIFSVLSLLGLLVGYQVKLAGEASSNWPTTPGVVASSEIETSHLPGESTNYLVRVSYHYTAAGHRRRGSGVKYHASISRHVRADAEVELAKYPVGKEVTVYVNPKDPAEAILIPGASLEGFALMALGCMFGVFALAFWGLALSGRPPEDAPQARGRTAS